MPTTYYNRSITLKWPGYSQTRLANIQTGYKQQPLVNTEQILSYNRTFRCLDNFVQLFPRSAEPFDAPSCGPAGFMDSSLNSSSTQYKAAHAKAWGKMMESSKDPTSELGVSLAEGREAIAMILQRSRVLGKAFLALKKGNFYEFVRVLGVRPNKKDKDTRWTRPKDASALWLEYWLGWAPMVADMYNCMDVLQKEHWSTISLKGRGSAKLKGGFKEQHPLVNSWWDIDGQLKVELGCKVRVANPNAYLANLMGLVNPASIAWAVVPFSFIGGWFMNLQQVLDSFTDFVGLAILPNTSYTTRYAHATGNLYRWDYPGDPPVYWKGKTSSWVGHTVIREQSLHRPALRVWVPARLSPTRAATSVSLLVSIFTKG